MTQQKIINLGLLSATKGFKIQGDAAFDNAGRSVSDAGDVNGDGIADLIVGALNHDGEAGLNSGAAYVVYGSNGGPSETIDLGALQPTQGFSIFGGNSDLAGYSVSSAGDVNGDGIDDLIVGAPDYDEADSYTGAAYVVYGTLGGRSANIDLGDLQPAQGFKIKGAAHNDFAGNSVSSAGDVNGDGVADLIVGARSYDGEAGLNSGAAYVVYGATGFTRGDVDLADMSDDEGYKIAGSSQFDATGGSVSSAGDINGDGIDDFIVGANKADVDGNENAGAAYVVYGTKGLTHADIDLAPLTSAQWFVIKGASSWDYAGVSVSSAGDINGDGVDDLIVGATYNNAGGMASGAAYVIYGAKGTRQADIDLAELTPDQGFKIKGASPDDSAGISVSSAGDVNGDGVDDLIVGAKWNDAGGQMAGAAYVVYGSNEISRGDVNLATLTAREGFIIQGESSFNYAGTSVSAAGDINGDGVDDIVVGAFKNSDSYTSAGAAYVVYGTKDIDLAALTPTQGFKIQGAVESDNAGSSVSSAGDVNGDGIDDVIVGTSDPVGTVYVVYGTTDATRDDLDLSTLTPSQGFAVQGTNDIIIKAASAAGDINGDGADDLVVASTGFNGLGRDDPGAAFVIYGTTDGSHDNINLGTLTSGQGFSIIGGATYDYIGDSVSAAGDVNRDGIDDLIIGAKFINDDAGAAYVIYGSSASGDIDLANLTPTQGFSLLGASSDDNAGTSVSSAGDVNGDGIDDLIVGAPGYGGGSGAAYVVYGSSGVIPSVINLGTMNLSQGFAITGMSADDGVGHSVSSAGDVNGDGLDDLIIGAPTVGFGFFDSQLGFGAQGAAYVIYGKQGGAGADIDLGAMLPGQGFTLLGTLPDFAGVSVSAAGDVNGDGIDDILIGTLYHSGDNGYAGAAYVVYGTDGPRDAVVDLGALTAREGFTISGEAEGDAAGGRVSAAGDVNGDGVDDLIVGASSNDGGAEDAGAAYVIYGVKSIPNEIDLTALKPREGFTITGAWAGDFAGFSVSSAGDVNGDGIDDFIVGAKEANAGTGAAYVVYGTTGSTHADIDLGELTSGQGFTIHGGNGDYAGISVSSAGDINGDGIDDLIVGAYKNDAGGDDKGAAYVIYGSSTEPSLGGVNLDALTSGQGFAITGAANGDRLGFSVSAAGDVNGDGVDDLIVGAPENNAGDDNAGAAYVIYGSTEPNRLEVNVAGLTQNDGFTIKGASEYAYAGWSVSAAGDINGDGYDDLIIGAKYAQDASGDEVGAAYVIYGASQNLPAVIDLEILLPIQGFVMRGAADNDAAGWSVSAAGDVNGDGIDDLIVGAWRNDAGGIDAGAAYVIYGTSGATRANIDLGELTSNQGFVIRGTAFADRAGSSVSAAGDVNGDGIDDLIVGAPRLDYATNSRGAAYVIYGTTGPREDVIDLGSLTANEGFIAQGAAVYFSNGPSVSAAGDVNGDGFDDLIIGASYSDVGGINAGSAYIIFGQGLPSAGPIAMELNGTADGETLTGGELDDTLNGLGGNDTLDGGAGDDTLDGGTGNDSLTGGAGNDTLSGGTGDDNLDGGSGDDNLDGGSGNDSLYGGIGNDAFYVDSVNDVVSDSGGNDFVLSSITYTLLAGFENLTLTSGNIDGIGNASNNVMTGSSGANSLSGLDSNDLLNGNDGNDTLDGGTGDDLLDGGAGDDALTGGDGIDTATYASAGSAVSLDLQLTSAQTTGGAGTDTLVSIENLIGSGYNDSLVGDNNANTLDGGAGNDTLDGGAGDDSLGGSDGIDTATYSSAGSAVSVDLQLTSAQNTGGAGTDALVSIENLIGSGYDDSLAGDNNANTLSGKNGNDSIFGRDGNDTLDGGDGNDELEGNKDYDLLNGGDGDDTLYGGLNDDTLFGGDGDDNLDAGGHKNVLYGGDGNDILFNYDDDDTLYGGSGDDAFFGNIGDDLLAGDDGNDTAIYIQSGGAVFVSLSQTSAQNTGGGGTDTLVSIENLTGSGYNDSLTGDNNANTLYGDGGDDTLDGGAGNDTLDGGTGNDSLYGGAGDDTLSGGTGDDLMDGGAGDDTYVLTNPFDSFADSGGTDLIESSITYQLLADFENLTLTGIAITGAGNALDNVIIGNDSDNTLGGYAGHDTVYGGAGNDALHGGTGDDILAGGEGDDTLAGNEGNDTLDGGAGHDTFYGDDGDDSLIGGEGDDTLTGGAGNDTFVVGSVADVVVEQSGEGSGTDLVQSSVSYTLSDSDNIENLTLTGSATTGGGNGSDNTITGNAHNNTLSGLAGHDALYGSTGSDTLDGGTGDDTLDGGTGNDSLTGGSGNDIYVVDSANDVVVEASDGGSADKVESSVSLTLFENVERLTLTGGGNTNGTGNVLNNMIEGNSGANILSGLLGNDELFGGTGNDTLYGGSGDDWLLGGSGNDSMTGGSDNDLYLVEDAGDVVVEAKNDGYDGVYSTVTHTLAANVETLTLIQLASINGTGNALANIIIGNSAANVLSGLDGNDRLIGYGGNDTLIGGAGDDIYVVEDTNDVLVEARKKGIDLVESSISYVLQNDFENLTLYGDAANGTGNSLSNVITGNGIANLLSGGADGDTLFGGAGDDTLDGGRGGDRMVGGSGDDTYITDSSDDAVVESADEGTDLVFGSSSYRLSANLENLTLTGSAAIDGWGTAVGNVITGNGSKNSLYGQGGSDTIYGGSGNDNIDGGADDDTLEGGAGSDTLNGGTGDDSMSGGSGNDTYVVDSANDVVVEGLGAAEGTDLVQSSIGHTLAANVENLTLTGSSAINGAGNALANVITGNSGANRLSGDAGNDTLEGGAGADRLTGGIGADTFVFNQSSGIDRITDFAKGTDKISLSKSDFSGLGDVGTLTSEAFYAAAGAVTAHDGTDRVIYNKTTGALYYDADGQGGAAAVQFAVLDKVPALAYTDVLIF